NATASILLTRSFPEQSWKTAVAGHGRINTQVLTICSAPPAPGRSIGSFPPRLRRIPSLCTRTTALWCSAVTIPEAPMFASRTGQFVVRGWVGEIPHEQLAGANRAGPVHEERRRSSRLGPVLAGCAGKGKAYANAQQAVSGMARFSRNPDSKRVVARNASNFP